MATSIKNPESKPVIFTSLLGRRMIVCTLIGLVAISFFVIAAGKGSPEWGSNWQLKPLLLTPALCAIIGLCYDITEPLRKLKGWSGKLFLVLSILGVLAGMWISLILGMNGTMWD